MIVKAMITVSAAASIFAIFQSFMPALQMFRPIPLASLGHLTIFRSGAGWRNPNYFALYVTMILPITYVCKMSKLFPGKKFLNICFVLQLLGVFSTYSRLGLISISLTFLCMLWVRGKRYLAVIILIVLVLLPTIAFLNMEYIYKNNTYLAKSIFRIARFEAVNKNPLLIAGWRRDAWIANVRMFLDRPFLGVGPYMSTDMYSEYRPYDEVFPWEDLAVHNEYLSLLSERGIFGLVLFLVFLLFLSTRAIVYYKNNKTSVHGKLMLGLWASIMNFIWFSFGAAAINSVQFWINVGIIFALYNCTKNELETIDNDLRDGALNG
ncbi:MAG: O-antigen ligase family protein [Candidatus Omnitrophica bacterium]|nr:O-antigen ligase family protein [Candidatus Omnitrophota bacterium]